MCDFIVKRQVGFTKGIKEFIDDSKLFRYNDYFTIHLMLSWL